MPPAKPLSKWIVGNPVEPGWYNAMLVSKLYEQLEKGADPVATQRRYYFGDGEWSFPVTIGSSDAHAACAKAERSELADIAHQGLSSPSEVSCV